MRFKARTFGVHLDVARSGRWAWYGQQLPKYCICLVRLLDKDGRHIVVGKYCLTITWLSPWGRVLRARDEAFRALHRQNIKKAL